VEYLNDNTTKLLLEGLNVSASELTASTKQLNIKRKADWEEELEIEKETIAYTTSIGTKDATIKSTSSIAQEAKKAKATTIKPPPAGVKSITSFFAPKKQG
jgi:hypothetical protein